MKNKFETTYYIRSFYKLICKEDSSEYMGKGNRQIRKEGIWSKVKKTFDFTNVQINIKL